MLNYARLNAPGLTFVRIRIMTFIMFVVGVIVVYFTLGLAVWLMINKWKL